MGDSDSKRRMRGSSRGRKTELAGRVGQRATATATRWSLVEPDVQISRIRLSWKSWSGAHARRYTQELQTELLEMIVIRHPFRQSIGALATVML